MMNTRIFKALMLSAWLGLAGPALAGGNSCLFQAKGLSLGFGTLDPASGLTVTVPVAAATLNADQAGDCSAGQNMVISGDNGQWFNGSRRMRSASGDFIAYSLTLPTPSVKGPGNNVYLAFTFNGVVEGAAYANASAGTYTDTVIISVTP
jgi:spore coat protein U-like protein